MTIHALLFTLSCIGISETVYLIQKRRGHEKPVCFLGGKCGVVLSSKWNKIFGIHNDILGLIFYITLSLLSTLLVLEVGPVLILEKILYFAVGSGTLMSLYFIFLQWKVIKAWCVWCLISAGTTILMSLSLLFNLLILN